MILQISVNDIILRKKHKNKFGNHFETQVQYVHVSKTGNLNNFQVRIFFIIIRKIEIFD